MTLITAAEPMGNWSSGARADQTEVPSFSGSIFFDQDNLSSPFATDAWSNASAFLVQEHDGWSTLSPMVDITAAIPQSAAPIWKLVWADEFDGSVVDPAKWRFETGTGSDGWGNQESQYYTSAGNGRVSNGYLVIEARKEHMGGRDYTSARMVTEGKASWTYGKVEARIKLPYGKGIWPAFWMLGENRATVGWPACGEIDIMEMVGGMSANGKTNNDTLSTGALYRELDSHGLPIRSSHVNAGGGPLHNDFHVFTAEWTPSTIKHFVDGELFQSVDISSKRDGFEAFHKPFSIIMNLAVGGNWPGYPDASTVFPQQMVVDWVRVYEPVTTSASKP